MAGDVAELRLCGVTRRFASGGGVDAIDLEIGSGEFFVLLGPSGCGKSTLLRLVAGLETPDAGVIELGGRAISDGWGAARGEVAMVFQNFALYPHMSAFDNIAFPLRLRRLAATEIGRRVGVAAKTAGLDIDLGRRPGELSGGERQRVALARALVREPRVVLMDEPLSSLDAKLRASLRIELKDFHRRTGRTFIYVTHDQTDALTLADRLAVMRAGRIEQLGTPADVYGHPRSEFVAGFVGEPAMNLVRATITPDRTAMLLGDTQIALRPPPDAAAEVTVGIRPADLKLSPPPDGAAMLDGEVETAEFIGARYFSVVALGPGARLGVETATRLEPGAHVRLYALRERLHFFDAASGRRLE